MKILVIVHQIGGTASGIVSQRVIDGLISQGHELVIITSQSSKSYENIMVYTLTPLLKLGGLMHRILNKILRIVGMDVFNANYIWRVRACLKISEVMRIWKPDCVYCRTSPIDPCYVGIWTKQKYDVPLVTNLTDPLPAPIEYLSDLKIRNKRKRAAREIIIASDLISMGTLEAQKYQIQEVGIDFSEKAFISPDPVPTGEIRHIPRSNKKNVELLYLGNVYGSRNINPLLEAISLMQEDGYLINFRICGSITPRIEHDCLIIDNYVSDFDTKLTASDILIDIDGDDKLPMFISSKLKQYLVTNRPILSITPFMSPSYKLLQGLDSVKVVSNNKSEIYQAILHLIKQSNLFDYNDRIEIVDLLTPQKIVADIISNITARVLNK